MNDELFPSSGDEPSPKAIVSRAAIRTADVWLRGKVKEIAELKQRLPLLKEWRGLWRQKHGYDRAFLIEFAGMPKSGKSSTIANVRHFLSYGQNETTIKTISKHNYQIHTPAEGVSQRTPRYLKQDWIDYNS